MPSHSRWHAIHPLKNCAMESLYHIPINKFKTSSGDLLDFYLSYQIFGKPLHEAPVVLVNHALTGNSNVCGDKGWWCNLIGPDKCIDTNAYTVLSFNVPGNCFSTKPQNQFISAKTLTARDVAQIFGIGLKHLDLHSIFAVIGGSVGGGIAWELCALYPKLTKHLIPIATDWKSTDWVIANCHIQDSILKHSKQPVYDARLHAMTLYRTPESFSQKFSRTKNTVGLFNVESWLTHHGSKLNQRFKLRAYSIMNHILRTIDITQGKGNFTEIASKISASIHMITISTDLLFKAEENWSSYVDLKCKKDNVFINEIKSIHGHDAFLIEYEQLQNFLKPVFRNNTHCEPSIAHINQSEKY